MEKFTNNFLLSMPHLKDSIFNKSLIYVCNHNKSGAMGVIINKPISENNTENILKETGLEQLKPKIEIYFGGPVDIEVGIFLHDEKYKTDGTINISKSISLSSDKKIISDIKNGNGPCKFKFVLGYAGWSAGQLEKEIENGDWLLVPSNDKIIFNIPYEKMIEQLKSVIDIDINNFSGGLSGLS